jgi:hypothetical protein
VAAFLCVVVRGTGDAWRIAHYQVSHLG